MQDEVAFQLGVTTQAKGTYSAYFSELQRSFSEIVDSFKFFPNFLLIGYLAYTVGRWRGFMWLGLTVQGKMHNMGVILGGSFCQPETREARELAFRLYRYLTLCHVLLYKMHSSWLNHTTWADLVSLGLATHDEVKTLESVAYKTGWPWDTVTTWINMEVQRAAEAGQLSFIGAQKAVELSAEIRGSLTGFKGIFIINQPNQWQALMKVVIDLLILIYIVSSAFTSFEYWLGSFQLITFASVFLLTMPFVFSSSMIEQLNNPYYGRMDLLNIDGFISATERTNFASLRAAFEHTPIFQGQSHGKSALAASEQEAI